MSRSKIKHFLVFAVVCVLLLCMAVSVSARPMMQGRGVQRDGSDVTTADELIPMPEGNITEGATDDGVIGDDDANSSDTTTGTVTTTATPTTSKTTVLPPVSSVLDDALDGATDGTTDGAADGTDSTDTGSGLVVFGIIFAIIIAAAVVAVIMMTGRSKRR